MIRLTAEYETGAYRRFKFNNGVSIETVVDNMRDFAPTMVFRNRKARKAKLVKIIVPKDW